MQTPLDSDLPPQIKILQCLAESSRPLTRSQIARRVGISESRIGDYAGPQSLTSTKKAETMDLLGYVTVEVYDLGGRDVYAYSITPKGMNCLRR